VYIDATTPFTSIRYRGQLRRIWQTQDRYISGFVRPTSRNDPNDVAVSSGSIYGPAHELQQIVRIS
jgi:hypothetical protein